MLATKKIASRCDRMKSSIATDAARHLLPFRGLKATAKCRRYAVAIAFQSRNRILRESRRDYTRDKADQRDRDTRKRNAEEVKLRQDEEGAERCESHRDQEGGAKKYFGMSKSQKAVHHSEEK